MSIAAAAALAVEFAPDIISLFSKDKGDKVNQVAEVVNSVAQSITGKTGDEAQAILSQDPALALEFKKAVMADKHIDEEMRYKDVSDAREMYKQQNDMADYVGKKIIDGNLYFVGGLIFLDCILIAVLPGLFPDSPNLATGIGTSVGTLIGAVIQQLLKERQDIVNFLFGSSRGSKIKDHKKAT